MCISDVEFAYVINQLGKKYLKVRPGTFIGGFEISAQSLITRGFSSSNQQTSVRTFLSVLREEIKKIKKIKNLVLGMYLNVL